MTTRSMAGNVFDLSDPSLKLPEYFVVDTNIVAERLLDSVLSTLPDRNLVQAQRADHFFTRLRNEDAFGFITRTVYSELFHLAIKFSYQQQALLQGRNKNNWMRLYKANPTFIQTLQPRLQHLQFLISVSRLLLSTSDGGTPSSESESFDRRLVELCLTHSLDTQDAGILFEAERLGVVSIVTLDIDLQRAQSHFDIYTWL